MDSKVGRCALLLAVGWLGFPATAWAGAELALTGADDSFGIIVLMAALVGFWTYFRTTSEDQI